MLSPDTPVDVLGHDSLKVVAPHILEQVTSSAAALSSMRWNTVLFSEVLSHVNPLNLESIAAHSCKRGRLSSSRYLKHFNKELAISVGDAANLIR